MLTTVILAVLSYMGGCATFAAECLRRERNEARLQAKVRRLTVELAGAQAQRQRWQ